MKHMARGYAGGVISENGGLNIQTVIKTQAPLYLEHVAGLDYKSSPERNGTTLASEKQSLQGWREMHAIGAITTLVVHHVEGWGDLSCPNNDDDNLVTSVGNATSTNTGMT